MDEQTDGIVLRTRPLTESSLIVHWLTQTAGPLATVAKGARRPSSPFRGKLDLFDRAALSFRRSRRTELHILREVQIQETFPALRADVDRLRQAAYASILVEKLIEREVPVEPVFHELDGLLHHLAVY